MSKKVVLLLILINTGLYFKINSSDEKNNTPSLSRLTIQVPQYKELDFYHNQFPSPEEKNQLRDLQRHENQSPEYLESSDEDYSESPIRKKPCILRQAKKYESYSDSEYNSDDISDSEAEENIMSPAPKECLSFLGTVECLLRSTPSASSSSTINRIDCDGNTQLHLLASRALVDKDRNKTLKEINKALHDGANTLQKNRLGLTPLQLFRRLQFGKKFK